MSTAEPVDRERIASDFRTQMEGKLDPAQIDAGAAAITAAGQSYPATLTVDDVGTWRVQVQGGKLFTGRAIKGVAGPVGGDVYTNDIQRLYSDTTTFYYGVSPAYVTLIFFDSSYDVLGTFRAGAASLVSGVGGGKGSWS
jgi:hypothetical protein